MSNLNFTVSELIHSDMANANKIDNIPKQAYIYDNMLYLIFNVLQPMRNALGVINVNSGYRCEKLNKLVNGSNTSGHLYGQCADIIGKNSSLKTMYDFVVNHLEYDECFLETNKSGVKWLHVGYRYKANRFKHNPNYLA